jgi:hypothetical protein
VGRWYLHLDYQHCIHHYLLLLQATEEEEEEEEEEENFLSLIPTTF